MADYKEIIAFFDSYIAHYREFLRFEYKKLDMINKDEIERLSASLSTEQALIMKTNSLEARREKLLAGIEGETFADIAGNAPEEYRTRLLEQHGELSGILCKIKEINDTANIIVSERLKKIQKRTAELDVYNGKGAVRREHAEKAVILKNV